MTKEELEKEAEDWLNKWELCNKCENKVDCISNFSYCKKVVLQSYLASAEPREKRIAELIEQNTSLLTSVENLNKSVQELETRCNELFLQTCEQAEKIKELKSEIENDRDLPAIAYMQGAEKQKKKDEEELQKWKDEWQEQVQKATDESYARTLQTIQLTKATEIIKKFLLWENDWHDKTESKYELLKQAEQFIKDSEVEK